MTFLKKVWSYLKKAFGSTNWEQATISTLNVVGPLLVSIVAFAAGGPAAAAVSAVIEEIKRDLGTLIGLVQSYQIGDHATITARIQQIVDETKANLAALLEDAHIKNTALQAKIQTIANTVGDELDGIVKNIPAPVSNLRHSEEPVQTEAETSTQEGAAGTLTAAATA